MKGYPLGQKLRRGVQAVAFALAGLLVILTARDAHSTLRATLLLRLDPLAALGAMLASRQWLVTFIPALVLLAASLALGRAWCGWLCPVGALLDWTAPRRRARQEPKSGWRRAKYGLLIVLLGSALWANLTWFVLDPLTWFVRSAGIVALPTLSAAIMGLERAFIRVRWLRGPISVLDGALQGTLLSYKQPLMVGITLLALALAAVLALNLWAPRAWCRYLCPLGGLYALMGKLAWLKRRVGPSCNQCGACARACPLGAILPARNFASDGGECTLCLDCAAKCPQKAISFVGGWGWDGGWQYDPTRRQALGAIGASLAGVALLRATPTAKHPDPHLLRPPGAQEATLLARCVRCGVCLRACPTHGLQPAWGEAGLEGLWTPVLRPRLGQCDYGCNACGQVCPTGAIPPLTLEVKRQTSIGKAYIDPKLCLAWSKRAPCIVCEEMCPVPHKAIVLEETEWVDPLGVKGVLQLPVVEHARCIGCGLCEQKCPIHGEAAIRVIIDPLG